MAPRITCDCGICRKCKHRAYMRSYYRRNAQRMRDVARASRNRRLEDVRAYDRARGHRIYDIEKERARRAFTHAIEDGKLVREPCELCGDPKSEGHHDDYAHPLNVRWLCRTHHMELHRRVAA